MVSCTLLQIHAATVAPLRINQASPVPTIDICIVGAGVVGLALARELARVFPSKEIVVLEKHDQIGQETSSRNSEVIHAGIYYPPDSLKARACVRGRELLYHYCEQHQIPCKRTGKLIVAREKDGQALDDILRRASANGVESLQLLDKRQIHQMEPAISADIALWSPETGIVDSHSLMHSFLHEAQSRGTTVALRSQLLRAEVLGNDRGFKLHIQSGPDGMTLHTRILLNCAGLHAATVASTIEGLPTDAIPAMDYIKGNYLSYSGKSPFTHLIYPVPDPAQRGLGIHATLDMAGQCRFGPDIEPVTHLEYTIDEKRISLFDIEIRRYYPELDTSRLQTAYAGIRPRLKTSSGVIPDFIVQGKQAHGAAGLWQLFGIESPGLTASMALAEQVRELIEDSAIL